MKIALYARVSTERQKDERTIDSQIDALDDYAKEHEHVVIDKYIDNGYSGTLLARPELDRLRDDAAKELFDAILIHSPDRLARKYAWQEVVREELKSKEIQIIFLNQPAAKTAEDQLLLGVQGIIAEYERAKFTERTRRGRLHRAKSNHIIGNIPPYGYNCVKKIDSGTGYAHYTVNESEAEIVRTTFKLLVKKRMTTNGIVTELNRMGYKGRKGNRWARSSISKVLRNSTYTGTTYYNKHYCVPSNNQNGHAEKVYHRRKNTSLRTRQKEDWIAITGIPVVIEEGIFLRAQAQLKQK